MHQGEHKGEIVPISVSKEVLDGLDALREHDHTNMLDVKRVAELRELM